MNFELKTLFRFQNIITEMQEVCLKIADEKVREAAVKRIDSLLEIYKTFDKYYYSAHFNTQKVLYLENENQELRNLLLEKQNEINTLQQTLEWNNLPTIKNGK